VTSTVGRREASKQATSAALRQAAARLFAERGYEGATVRDIAELAGVTERTLYRYFDGKEGLVAEDYSAWLRLLQDAIAARPPGEPPLAAVRNAMVSLARQAPATGLVPLWLFLRRPAAGGLHRSAPRALLRAETAVAEAVRARLEAGDGQRVTDELTADVIARVAIAVLRSATIRWREERARGVAVPVTAAELLERAFDVLQVQVAGA
jgi:AcrR family transcriptional regulator